MSKTKNIVWCEKHQQNYRIELGHGNYDVVFFTCLNKSYYLQHMQMQTSTYKRLVETRKLVVVG